MSTPIKPPGGGDPPGADSPDGVSGDKGFDQAVEAAETGEASSVEAQPTTADQVAADLKAGRIDMDTAIDSLVDQAARSGTAQALTDAGRSELRAFLRQALETDPALQQLLGEMEG